MSRVRKTNASHRRRRVAVAIGCAIAGVGVGVGIGYHLGRRQRLELVPTAVAPVANPEGDQRDLGLSVEDGRIVVESYDRLFAFLPAAFEDARRSGIRGAEQILASAIRRALPRHAWPPPADSVLAPQWRALVAEVAKAFETDDDPVPTRRLHLV